MEKQKTKLDPKPSVRRSSTSNFGAVTSSVHIRSQCSLVALPQFRTGPQPPGMKAPNAFSNVELESSQHTSGRSRPWTDPSFRADKSTTPAASRHRSHRIQTPLTHPGCPHRRPSSEVARSQQQWKSQRSRSWSTPPQAPGALLLATRRIKGTCFLRVWSAVTDALQKGEK